VFDRFVPPDEHDTFESWQQATQAYQALVVRRQIEALRRIKYRPTGGFAQFCFADGHPAVTWSVLGHDRAPKLGFDALRAACAPVIVVTDRLPEHVQPGEVLSLDVHVISDLRNAISGAEVTAVARWNGGEQTWRWQGDVPADTCQRVGTMQLTVPDAPGALTIDLLCRHADATAISSA